MSDPERTELVPSFATSTPARVRAKRQARPKRDPGGEGGVSVPAKPRSTPEGVLAGLLAVPEAAQAVAAPAPLPGKAVNNDSVAVPITQDTSREKLLATLLVVGTVGNASTMAQYGTETFGAVSLHETALALRTRIKDVWKGDLSGAEGMLVAQAASLNVIYGEMARRAAAHMGKDLEFMERYLRLALKAQGQCRTTLESLAAIKNPPVVFARQANFAQGAQQVNNGSGPAAVRLDAQADAKTPPSKLLEQSNGERLDTRAAGTAGRGDPPVEALEPVHRPPDQ